MQIPKKQIMALLVVFMMLMASAAWAAPGLVIDGLTPTSSDVTFTIKAVSDTSAPTSDDQVLVASLDVYLFKSDDLTQSVANKSADLANASVEVSFDSLIASTDYVISADGTIAIAGSDVTTPDMLIVSADFTTLAAASDDVSGDTGAMAYKIDTAGSTIGSTTASVVIVFSSGDVSPDTTATGTISYDIYPQGDTANIVKSGDVAVTNGKSAAISLTGLTASTTYVISPDVAVTGYPTSGDLTFTTTTDSGNGGGGGGGGSTPVDTPVSGSNIVGVVINGNQMTVTLADGTTNTYNLDTQAVTVTYTANQFAMTPRADGTLVFTTPAGMIIPAGTPLIITATSVSGATPLSRGAIGDQYQVNVTATAVGGVTEIDVPKSLFQGNNGTYDLTFTTQADAKPAFKGTLATNYTYTEGSVNPPITGRVLEVYPSLTTDLRGVKAYATVHHDGVPQAGVVVEFSLYTGSTVIAESVPALTDENGVTPTVTLGTNLPNAVYSVSAAAADHTTVIKTVNVDESWEPGSGSSGCSAGFGLLALMAGAGAAIALKRRGR